MLVHSSRGKKRLVSKPATVSVIKPKAVDEKPKFDISKASIEVIKPDTSLHVMVVEKISKKESK